MLYLDRIKISRWCLVALFIVSALSLQAQVRNATYSYTTQCVYSDGDRFIPECSGFLEDIRNRKYAAGEHWFKKPFNVYSDSTGKHKLEGQQVLYHEYHSEQGVERFEWHAAFVDGVLHGGDTLYRNSILTDIGNYYYGLKHGEQIEYSGQQKTVSHYRYGVKDGLQSTYHHDTLWDQCTYVNGMKSGWEQLRADASGTALDSLKIKYYPARLQYSFSTADSLDPPTIQKDLELLSFSGTKQFTPQEFYTQYLYMGSIHVDVFGSDSAYFAYPNLYEVVDNSLISGMTICYYPPVPEHPFKQGIYFLVELSGKRNGWYKHEKYIIYSHLWYPWPDFEWIEIE